MELVKQNAIADGSDAYYFWRTHTGKEVDIIRESRGALVAIECKWSDTAKEPKLWKETYPDSSFMIVNRKNYLDALVLREKTGN